MKKLTAVEWFFNELERQQYFIGNGVYQAFKQAKELEKEQIEDAYRINPNNEIWSNSGIDYYNETFNNGK